MSDQAIVFLTHVQSERVFEHFRRLREETSGLLPTLLCIHDPSQLPHFAKRVVAKFQPSAKTIPTPDIKVVDVKSGRRLLPNRFSQMQRRGAWYNNGFTDLCYMPALLDKELACYEYIWIMENDVDYAGNWGDFFRGKMESRADLIGTWICARWPEDDWHHWSWFHTPPEVSFAHHTRSMLCIARFSRRLLLLYMDAVWNELWQGHPEALFPTIARHNGLTVSDLGAGEFCPEQWRGKSYHYPWVEGWAKATFLDAPTVQSVYFHEEPTRFREPNLLYHPVKAGWTKAPPRRRSLAFRSRFQWLKPTLRFWSN